MVGQRLVDHPAVRKIVFTGSTEVGQQIMAGCARQVKRLTLELGGKSANIVFADSDLERAAATAPYAVFDNAGQDCCARSRILVQRSVLDRFMALFEPAVQGVAVGDPAAEKTEMGPLISAAHRARVAGYVPAGAPVAFRGHAPDGPGFWYPPTVLAPVRPDDPAYTEEVFGPVVTVTPFEDEADAMAMANDTPYGLSGSIWTCDVGRAIRVARAVETGNLSVNSHSSVRYWTPFGGFKQSGLGRELGPDAPGRVHRDQERLHLDASEPEGRRAWTESAKAPMAGSGYAPEAERADAALAGPGRGRHRSRQRDRPGQCPPARRRGRPGGGGRHRRGGGQGGRGRRRRRVRRGRRDQRGRRSGGCSRRWSAQYGRVDIAFNNAGISPPEDDSILTTGLEAWRRVQEVNLTSVYLCCKYVIPHMQRQGKGSIINTASFVAVLGAATSQISYTASKGGVLAMSRELGVQFAREGIRVNALCPGPVNTPLLQELFAKDPERAARRLVHVPMGRFAEPDEIAAAVAFLASDDSSFITASRFLVDGGISGAYVTPL